MALTNTLLNSVRDYLKDQAGFCSAITTTFSSFSHMLSSTDPSFDVIVSPLVATIEDDIDLAFNTGTDGVAKTQNRPSNSTYPAISFIVAENKTANTIVFGRSGSGTISGKMQLATPVSGGTYGAPLYLDYIQFTVSEV